MIPKLAYKQPDLFDPLAPDQGDAAAPVEPAPIRVTLKLKSKPKPKKAGAAADIVTLPDMSSGAMERYLCDHEVAKRFGASRATVWRWCQSNPVFPQPIKVSSGVTRWALSELMAFEAAMRAEPRCGVAQSSRAAQRGDGL